MTGWPRLGKVGPLEAKWQRRQPGCQGLSEPETAGTASLRDLGRNRCAARSGSWGGDEEGMGRNARQGEAQHKEETAAKGQG